MVRIDLKEHNAIVKAKPTAVNGKEIPANLIDEGEEHWNKYCQITSGKSRVEITMKKRIKVDAIGFKSANDYP